MSNSNSGSDSSVFSALSCFVALASAFYAYQANRIASSTLAEAKSANREFIKLQKEQLEGHEESLRQIVRQRLQENSPFPIFTKYNVEVSLLRSGDRLILPSQDVSNLPSLRNFGGGPAIDICCGFAPAELRIGNVVTDISVNPDDISCLPMRVDHLMSGESVSVAWFPEQLDDPRLIGVAEVRGVFHVNGSASDKVSFCHSYDCSIALRGPQEQPRLVIEFDNLNPFACNYEEKTEVPDLY